MSPVWHLAQINIGRLVAPVGDPAIAEFVAALGRVNAMADAAPGFVWRLTDDDESAGAITLRPTPDPRLAVNMSVWTDAESLFDYVYRSGHTPFMARRRQWFERFDGAYQALWWIEAGTIPSVDDGLAALWRIDRFGPSPWAFTFKTRFPAPGHAGPPDDMKPDPWCVGNA